MRLCTYVIPCDTKWIFHFFPLLSIFASFEFLESVPKKIHLANWTSIFHSFLPWKPFFWTRILINTVLTVNTIHGFKAGKIKPFSNFFEIRLYILIPIKAASIAYTTGSNRRRSLPEYNRRSSRPKREIVMKQLKRNIFLVLPQWSRKKSRQMELEMSQFDGIFKNI